MNLLSANTWRNPRLLLPLVVLITVMVFLPVCGHEFLYYDDSVNITENPSLASLSWANIRHFWQAPYLKLYIPLTYTLWSLQAALSRLLAASPDLPLNPHLFHTVNVLLHSATTAVVFLLLRRLGGIPWAAAAGAMLFAVHPLQVTPVAWATGFKDLLSGFWSMVALWQFTLGAQTTGSRARARLHHGLALASFALAMLSKPNAVAVPLLAAAIGFLELGQRPKRLLLTLSPWLLCALPIALMTRQAQPVADPELASDLTQRFLIAGDALTFYVTKLAFPLTLGPDYGRTPEFVLSQPLIYVTGLLPYGACAYLLWKRPQPLFTAACLFVLALLPTLGFIPFNFQQVSTVAGRYLYLSMLGPAFALCYWLPRTTGTLPKAVFLIVITLLAAKSMVQERHWQNPLTFSQHAVEVNPNSWFFLNNLGNAYHAARQTEQAIASLNRSIALKPDFELPYINLAVVYKETGQAEKAISYYQKVLALQPTLAAVHNDLAMVYFDQGDITKALEHLNTALAIQPQYDSAYANLGIVYTSKNNPKAALTAYRQAIAINPTFAEAYVNLGALYTTLGDQEAAITCFTKVIALRPSLPEPYNNLGLIYLESGRLDQAIPLFTKATETGGKSPVPWHNLGRTQLAAGNAEEAIPALKQAITVDPGFAPAYNTLAAAYLQTGQFRPAVEAADRAQALGLSDPEQMRAVAPYR
jgi:tetratricopeptide (TPR) repeat protein